MMHPSRHDDETYASPSKVRTPLPKAATGRPVGPRYRIVQEIASGGMGVVYRAEDPEMRRSLALKLLREEHADNPDMIRRFLEEARIAAMLQHPGIVPIHDMGRLPDGRPYFTMKLVEGRTLAAKLAARAGTAENLPRLLAVFEQVCQAIGFAHSQGVLHRDLKPSNVMVGAFGEVQVMDWGLAKHVGPGRPDEPDPEGVGLFTGLLRTGDSEKATMIGTIVGTPAYMPPEQSRGDALDKRADVFGLGGILCEILTGAPPFVVPSSLGAWLAESERTLADAYARLDGCGADPELVSLAMGCLAENPADRFADAGVVAQRVGAYREALTRRLRQAELDRAAAEARASSLREKVRAEGKARRMSVLLAVGLAVVIGGAVTWVQWVRQQRKAAADLVATLFVEIEKLRELASAGKADDRTTRHYAEALALVERGEDVLRTAVSSDPAQAARLAAYRADLTTQAENLRLHRAFVQSLNDIRMREDEELATADLDQAYRLAFLSAGLNVESGRVSLLAARLGVYHPVLLRDVASALDAWAMERRARKLPEHLWRPMLRLAAKIDDDPWRRQLRSAYIEPAASRLRGGVVAVSGAMRLVGAAGIEPTLLHAGLQTAVRRNLLLCEARAVRPEPLSGGRVHLLGSLLLQEQMYAEATRVLRDGSIRYPVDVWLHLALAKVSLLPDRRNEAEAMRHLIAVRARRPAMGHLLAHLLARAGKTDEAIDLFRELARLKPKLPHHRDCLVDSLRARGRLAEALAAAEAAVADFPAYGPLRAKAGLLIFAVRRDPAAALAYLEAGLTGTADTADLYSAMADIHLDTGRPADAERHAVRALDARPGHPTARMTLARSLSARGRHAEAADVYRQALARRDDAELHNNLGLQLRRLGKPDEARRHFETAVRLSPRLPQPRINLADLFEAAGHFADAAAQLEFVVAADPEDKDTVVRLAGLYSRAGDLRQSAAVLRRGCRSLPASADLAYRLGFTLTSLGSHTEAVESYRRAVALDPGFAEAHCNLGLALATVGEFDEALCLLLRGHELGTARGDKWRYPSASWVDRTRTAARLNAEFDDYLRGARRPHDADECHALAQIAGARRNVVARVEFLGFFAARPGVSPSICAEAAAAAMDLAGHADGGTAADREGHRRLALAYLGRLVARCDARAANTKLGPPWTGLTSEHLSAPALARTRDERVLATLPPAEREAWRLAWRRIDEARRRSAKAD